MNKLASPHVPLDRPFGVNAILVTVLCLVVAIGTDAITTGASAQSAGDPPSVMDRIREKAQQRQPAASGDWFQRLDTNRDSRISKEELQASINRRFGSLDTDRDGTISRVEFQARSTTSGQSGPSFNQMDVDRNDRLSLAEFSAPVLWRFARLDVDGDGFISRTEAARYLNVPASRSLPPLVGTCFEVDGRFVVVSPEQAEVFERTGRRQIDCAWQPGALPVR